MSGQYLGDDGGCFVDMEGHLRCHYINVYSWQMVSILLQIRRCGIFVQMYEALVAEFDLRSLGEKVAALRHAGFIDSREEANDYFLTELGEERLLLLLAVSN